MKSEDMVDITLTITTRNRASSLERTLDGLTSLELGALSWELIVVDNGSTDETREVLERAGRDLPLTALFEPRPGKNSALNLAREHARGELLVYTDDDVVVSPDWLVRLHQAAGRWPDVNIFGGRITPRFPDGTPEWLTDPGFAHGRWAFSHYAPRPDEGPVADTPLGPNLAIRADRLRGVTWDETIGPSGASFAMGSEVELLMRLRREGELFVYVPDATVEHVLSPRHVTTANLNARAVRCGRGNARIFSRDSPRYPILGVSINHWWSLARSGARWLVSLPARAERRVVAGFELRQEIGHVREVIGMRRQGELRGDARLFPTPGNTARAARKVGRRGRRALAGVLRPRSSVHVFEAPVGGGDEGPSGDGGHFEIEVHHGADALTKVLRDLARLGRPPAGDVEERLLRGDSVAIATRDGVGVGFAWSTAGRLPVAEAGTVMQPRSLEVIGYDIFVDGSFRGAGLANELDRAQMRFAAARGFRSQVVWVEQRNHQSLAAVRRMGKRRIGSIRVLRFPFFGIVRSWTEDPVVAERLV